MKKAVEDSPKISDVDKAKISETCNDTIKWLDSNQQGEKEEYEYKLKEIEDICNPLIYGQSDNKKDTKQSAGPTVEELD